MKEKLTSALRIYVSMQGRIDFSMTVEISEWVIFGSGFLQVKKLDVLIERKVMEDCSTKGQPAFCNIRSKLSTFNEGRCQVILCALQAYCNSSY